MGYRIESSLLTSSSRPRKRPALKVRLVWSQSESSRSRWAAGWDRAARVVIKEDDRRTAPMACWWEKWGRLTACSMRSAAQDRIAGPSLVRPKSPWPGKADLTMPVFSGPRIGPRINMLPVGRRGKDPDARNQASACADHHEHLRHARPKLAMGRRY